MGAIWRVEMLGTLQARFDPLVVSRFRTRRVGLLLAYLAYFGERSHSRDELADMLWPELEGELSRRNLRQALSSLRRHLEPPSVPTGSILIAEQARVTLNAQSVVTDVGLFTGLVQSGISDPSNATKIDRLKRAVDLYRGDLLPGYYEEWVRQERLRLEDLFVSALRGLVHAYEDEGQVDKAIRHIRLALTKDYLQEDLHATLMRLYLASARDASAVQHFEDWKAKLAAELHEAPSPELQALADEAKRRRVPPASAKPAGKRARQSVKRPVPERPDLQKQTVRLPMQITRFFGRRADRDRVVAGFDEHLDRLGTLLGPAGAGKTRLSVEIGRVLAEERGWNVWFVPLADVTDGAAVLGSVLDAMKLNREASAGPFDTLRAGLTGSKNLLILDNLEHILESSIPVVERILGEVPDASILVTSRHALKLGGEREFDLGALPTPTEETIESPSLAYLAQIPSIQLFVDRAQAVLPDFQITSHNARAVATVCARLDGLPLAIEIAAGLANAFTPAQLLQNLENRLEILRSRRRDLSERHRSLRAAIDYSYELLFPELQRFFVSLSVFRGGFTVDAAGQICLPTERLPESGKRHHDEPLRMILELQDRSLLRSEEAGEGCPPRFRLLESFREYGAEWLSEEESAFLRSRHAHYFLELVGRPLTSNVDERDNRLLALQFFVERREIHACVTLLVSLQTFSFTGRETIQELVGTAEFDSADPIDMITLLGLLSKAHRHASEYEESYRLLMRGLEVAKSLGRPDQVAIFNMETAVTLAALGRPEEAIEYSERTLRDAEVTGDLRAIEIAYLNIGTNRWSMGDFEGALSAFRSELETSTKRIGGPSSWIIYYNMSRVHMDSGNLENGLELAGEGLRIAQHRSDEFGTSMCLSLISLYHRRRGNFTAALATSHEALLKRRKAGYVHWTLHAIQAHAAILAEMGEYRDAATLFAASRNVVKQRREVDDREFAEGVRTVRENLSDTIFEQAWAAGLAMSLNEAFQLAASHV